MKIAFVLFMLSLGWHYGGGWGVYSMLIISALALIPFMHSPGYNEPPRLPRAEDWNPEEVISDVRKGHRDPTRPSEDAAAMITNNYGRGPK